MKEKILAQLRVKFPGVPKELLGRIADKMATKVTAEDQIQGAIGELDNLPLSITDYAAFLQQEGDRRVTDAKKTWEQSQSKQDEDDDEGDDPASAKPDPKPGKKEKKGGNDDIAKLTAAVQALTEKVNSNEQKHTQKTLTEQLHAKLGEKKIPVVFAKGRSVEKAEDLETVLAEIESDHNTYKQELVNQGFAVGTAPAGGNGGNVDKTKVEADIGAWATKHSPTSSSNEKKP
ncbi:hypothetical protein [Chitinophaga japonensis]|uniref:Uncharacterized protein n=1 Tax=Chitinophaga japonensis TaxID=104662 RepID=A0A562SZ54_CHIJA|nr:hypothetical protein [Chitinophaga japonensis]TWI86304.1 hypothetical protein LX66_3558 [Chitinophaga japonensis]